MVVLAAVALGLFLFLRNETREPDRWQASVQLLVPHRSEEGEIPESVPPRLLQGQSTVALSDDTIGAALRGIGLAEDARRGLDFDFSSNERGDIFTISVTSPNAEQAEALADSYANAYLAARRQSVAQGFQSQRDGARAAVGRLEERLAEVNRELQQTDPELYAGLPDTAEPADETLSEDELVAGATSDDPGANTDEGDEGVGVELPPGTPTDTVLLVYERQDLLRRIEAARRSFAEASTESLVPRSYATVVERNAPEQITSPPPSPLIPVAGAVAMGALLGVGVPVLLDRVDHSIRDGRVAGDALSAPVLSRIPVTPSSRLATLARADSPRGQAFRTLATASVATDQLPRAIVVTAPVGHMQDSVAANFAAALADLGLRVVLVPTHHRQAWYGDAPEGAPTLPHFLALAYTGRLNGQVPHQLLPTSIGNLRVVPHGETEADALIDGLPPLLRAFADAGVDVTVIAAPSILEDPSATILAWSTRSVLWVVETGEVTQQQASEAAARLELAGASPFGVALVDGKA
jgi:hypothetical protein